MVLGAGFRIQQRASDGGRGLKTTKVQAFGGSNPSPSARPEYEWDSLPSQCRYPRGCDLISSPTCSADRRGYRELRRVRAWRRGLSFDEAASAVERWRPVGSGDLARGRSAPLGLTPSLRRPSARFRLDWRSRIAGSAP